MSCRSKNDLKPASGQIDFWRYEFNDDEAPEIIPGLNLTDS